MTKEQARAKAQVMLAWADGKTLERSTGDGKWVADFDPFFDWYTYTWRIKPEPKRVPLRPEDIPPGSVVRQGQEWSRTYKWHGVIQVSKSGMLYGDRNYQSFKDLMDRDWEISRDLGKTWQPCWKEVEE